MSPHSLQLLVATIGQRCGHQRAHWSTMTYPGAYSSISTEFVEHRLVTCFIPLYRRSSSHSTEKIQRRAAVRTDSALSAYLHRWDPVRERIPPVKPTWLYIKGNKFSRAKWKVYLLRSCQGGYPKSLLFTNTLRPATFHLRKEACLPYQSHATVSRVRHLLLVA